MTVTLRLLTLAICLGIYGVKASSWSYKNNEEWKLHHTDCGCLNQSPIEINTKEALFKDMPPLTFHNYNSSHSATLTNNGHTARLFLLQPTDEPEISGGPLKSNEKYVFDNLHFHWGANDTQGSEHIINGHRYPMELHLVHRNKKYNTIAEAFTKTDGFAVITRFFEISHHPTYFEALNSIDQALTYIRNVDSVVEISNFKLSEFVDDLMVEAEEKLYTYRGSMTTPPCKEIVDWLIFTEPIPVTSAQLMPFRLLLDEGGEFMVNNYRDLQDIGERKVYVRAKEG